MKTFRHHIRVRYQETDQMGVVYHANYLNWFEIGRTEMIWEMGMPYRTLEAKGLLLPVIEADLKFHQPARYDDSITILTRIAEFSHLRIRFESEVHRESELLVSGCTRHVWLNRDWKPVRIDKEAPDVYALIKEWS
ncbi:acyl-CoA thioesterase [Paenibacillus naphthalenovorans]|uniref:acyl-CoA thioesterase n=1 Tax=Paenibacillus naphthalenovorans TaxID=162209 RepID=UPI003D2A7492